jgi:hypothetical protein
MLTDTAKQDTRATVDQPRFVVTTPGRGLSEAVRRIQLDSKREVQVYLDEVITPYGGE